MEKYYLHLDNEQKGPFTIGQLQAMWLAGSIDRNTQFYTKANGDWKKLEAILDLLEPSPSPVGPVGAAVAPVIAEKPAPPTVHGEKPAGESPVSSPAPEAAAPIPRAPAGLSRCPECGGLAGHLSGCPRAGQVVAGAPTQERGAPVAAKAQPPTPQEWQDRMAAVEQATGSEASRLVHESFPILNFFSSLMRGLGWLLFIIGGVLAVVTFAGLGGNIEFRTLVLFLPALGVMIAGILMIVLGEVIGVVFSIEKNTFKSARSLETIAKSMRLLSDISRKMDKQG